MSSVRGAPPACVPTWQGHIETTRDALVIFEAALQGLLAHCIRRPHDRERSSLIVSGNVFVYEEGTSGIKRWTDGIPWSPSRILTNFLIYRQLNQPFPPGEKKRATKRSQRPVKAGEPYAAPFSNGNGNDDGYSITSPTGPGLKSEESIDKDADRMLVGSLVDSYEFKEHGLLKKTMTVLVNGVHHHLVSYYTVEDAKNRLRTPRQDPQVSSVRARDELLNQPKFKFPNIDDTGDGMFDQMDNPAVGYPYQPSLQTIGGLPQLNHGPFATQDQSSTVYYPSYTPYVSHVTTPTSISNAAFTSMPSTPSPYASLGPTSNLFSPYSLQTQNHTQPQPQRRPSVPTHIKSEGQAQYPSQIHQQSKYPSNAQLHQISYPEPKHLPLTNYQQSPQSEYFPRRGATLNLNTHDALGFTGAFYPQGDNAGPSSNDGSLGLSQPIHTGFSNLYGSNSDCNYYTSRATS